MEDSARGKAPSAIEIWIPPLCEWPKLAVAFMDSLLKTIYSLERVSIYCFYTITKSVDNKRGKLIDKITNLEGKETWSASVVPEK